MTSALHRSQAIENLMRWHREMKPSHPRCGAKRKRDGEPCERVAMANGRCHFHGGKTGRGDDWHKPRWPNGKAPDAMQRLHRKLNSLQRAAKKRAKRVAEMTPEERERYETWHKARKPGSPAERIRLRQVRKMTIDMRKAIDEVDCERAARDIDIFG